MYGAINFFCINRDLTMIKLSGSGATLAKFALGLTMAATLAACGGGGDSPAAAVVAATNSSSAISGGDTAASEKIVAAILNKTFTFTAVPDFGTTADTTLELSGTGAAPSFSIGSGGLSAKGILKFGSCIFTVAESGFVAPHPLAFGQPDVIVTPCTLDAQTSGDTVGVTADTPVTFVLGTTKSEEIILPVSVAADGTVTVAGQTVGTVPVTTTTGGGS